MTSSHQTTEEGGDAGSAATLEADRIAAAALLLRSPEFMACLTRSQAPVEKNDRPGHLDSDPRAIDKHNHATVVAKANELLSTGEVNLSTGDIDDCPILEVRTAFNPSRVKFDSWEQLKAHLNKARSHTHALQGQWSASGWGATGDQAFRELYGQLHEGGTPDVQDLPGVDGRDHDEVSLR